MLRTRSKSSFTNPNKNVEAHTSSLRNKPNVNDEYDEVFRTNSYGEIWYKIRSHLGLSSRRRRSVNRVGPSSSTSSSSSSSTTSSSLPRYINPSESLLEQQEEFLVDDLVNAFKVNDLVLDYFKVGLEAYKVCGDLLHIVHQTKANYRSIRRIIKLAKRVLHDSMDDDSRRECINEITMQLASYALLENPLSSLSQVKFDDAQIDHGLLLKKLKTKYQRVNRRRKIKKAMGFNLMVTFTRLAFSLLVLIFKRTVRFVADWPLFGGCVGPTKKFQKLAKKAVKRLDPRELSRQLDVAARGVFTLIKYFDMMSRLGWRLHDEIEHVKSIADICIRIGNGVVWKEVVKEFESKEIVFLELLKEFEKHIYLCLLNVERSRRQLVDEIIGNDNLFVSGPLVE